MTGRQAYHCFGASNPQNNEESVRLSLPSQTKTLGPLEDDDRVLWQFDENVGLPVVFHGDQYGTVRAHYGEPDVRENGGTITLPKRFTTYAQRDDNPDVNFTLNDTIGFVAPEPKIADDFDRLYVDTVSDYERRTTGRPRVIWEETYQRSPFDPGENERGREVCVVRPGKDPIRTTRPAAEGWVSLATLRGS